jgi:hypothetical protein
MSSSQSQASYNAVGFASKRINNARMAAAANGGMQWYWNWTTGPKVSNTAGLEFVPMEFKPSITGIVAPSGPTKDQVLMYNEPDNPGSLSTGLCFENGQPSKNAAKKMADTYCQQVSQYLALGYTEIGTPAWSFDPSNPNDPIITECMTPFFEAVSQNAECMAATKYFVWHMYTSCDNQQGIEKFCTDRTSQYASLMEKMEKQMSPEGKFEFLGMYVTEFAGWGPLCVQSHGGDGSAGQALVAEFCTPILAQHSRMARFAWFNDFEDYPGQGTSDIFNKDDSLSNIGKAYLKAVGGSANGSNTATTTGSATTDADSTTASPSSTDADSTTASPSTTDADSTTASPSTTDADSTTASPVMV